MLVSASRRQRTGNPDMRLLCLGTAKIALGLVRGLPLGDVHVGHCRMSAPAAATGTEFKVRWARRLWPLNTNS
jgi:hypothetical protein